MNQLLHEFIQNQSNRFPKKAALGFNNEWLSYLSLNSQISKIAQGFIGLGLHPQQRVAIYLPKCFENVIAVFATSMARGVFVPVNPVLKQAQVNHILSDCSPTILITNSARWQMIKHQLPVSIKQVIITDDNRAEQNLVNWKELLEQDVEQNLPSGLETDIAAIFYTSGSTGNAKGVVLSQRNMVLGAISVAQYLKNSQDDRLLAVQPLSFDYGFSQLTTAFATGGSCYLMEYLFPADVIREVEQQRITGLALVPPLWIKLAEMDWPEQIRRHLRFITNTGGVMPASTLAKLQKRLPDTQVYLMYGLTEAFRSCYLPPEDISRKPGSFGKAIPNAEIHVINDKGKLCKAGEVGELIHSGPLVSQGYWNDIKKTKERFRPICNHSDVSEIAVWSGDLVKKDEDGYLYYVGRNDEMIKSSGYRISPTEIEQQLQSSGLVKELVAIGVPHEELGHAVILLCVPEPRTEKPVSKIKTVCLTMLPNYMQPKAILLTTELPRNANGKFDRALLTNQYQDYFQECEDASVRQA